MWLFVLRLRTPHGPATRARLHHPSTTAPAGASLSAAEDGRRLYLFGGSDGSRALNDVFFLELEKLSWTFLPVHVSACACAAALGGVPLAPACLPGRLPYHRRAPAQA